MRHLYLFVSLCLWMTSPIGLLSQELDRQNNYGGSESDLFNAMLATADGGYIMAGYSASADHDVVSGNHGNDDAWVVKLNSSGDIQWENHYGGSNTDRINDIQPTSDGGYIMAGHSMSSDKDVSGNYGYLDWWVVKIDASGNLIWEQNYGSSTNDNCLAIRQTPDGGYLAAGLAGSGDNDVASGNYGQTDAWVVKLTSSGTIDWEEHFGGSEHDAITSVQLTPEGKYLAAGYTSSADYDVSNNHGASDYWLIQLDHNGSLEWEKNYGGSDMDRLFDLQPTLDGGYIAIGYAYSVNGDVYDNHGGSDYWVVKLSSSGIVQWEQNYGGSNGDRGRSIRQTSDGGYIALGYSRSADHDVSGNFESVSATEDYWVVKINEEGAIEWEQNYGGKDNDYGFSILETEDGAYIASGGTHSLGYDVSANYGNYDAWVIRLCTPSRSETNVTACGSYTVPSGDTTYTRSGTYTDVISNRAGCDSVITIHLTVYPDVEASVIQNGPVLQAETFDANYQWGTCDAGFTPVAGALGQTFTADSAGAYAVMVEKNGCRDTSECFLVTSTSLKQISDDQPTATIYPNPAHDQLTIDLPPANEPSTLQVVDIHGEVLHVKDLPPRSTSARLPLEGPAGIYFVIHRQNGQAKTYKVIKEPWNK